MGSAWSPCPHTPSSEHSQQGCSSSKAGTPGGTSVPLGTEEPCLLLHAVSVPLPQSIPPSCTTEPPQGRRRRPRHRGEGKLQLFAGPCAAAELFHTSFHAAQCARGAHVYLCTPRSPSRHLTSPQCLGLSPHPPGAGTGNAGPFPRG